MKREGMWFDIAIILVVCALGMGIVVRHFSRISSPSPSVTPSESLTQEASPISKLTPENQPIQKTAQREEDIMEAVFRYQFENNASEHSKDTKVYFLSISDNDPGDQFLKRFQRNIPQVKKVSQSLRKKKENGWWGIVDKGSGVRGIVFIIDGIQWINNYEVVVNGGYSEHCLSGSRNIYRVVYQNNKWVVEEDTLILIS